MKFSRAVRSLLCLFAGASILCPPDAWAQKRQIRLRTETIQTSREVSAASVDRSAPEAAVRGLHLVQFTGPVRAEWRGQLEELGVDFVQYVPDDAFIVRLKNVPPGQIRRQPFVHWLGRYRPEHKQHAAIRNRPALTLAPATPIPVRVLMAASSDATEFAAARGLLANATEGSRLRMGTIVSGTLNPAMADILAASEAVLWIEPAPRMELFDEESSKIIGGDDGLRSTPTLTQQLGHDGSGVVVAVADSGLDTGDPATMHPDLAGRVDALLFYGSLTDASDEHSHGTHVAGIVAGNAALGETDEHGALYGLGVAPGARIVAQRIFDGIGNFTYPHASFEPLTRDAVSAGADIGSNSWGEDTQGRYDLSAAEFDELVRDADSLTPGDQPYILEFSAGNAGPGSQSIGTPAVAKNVIATGASQNNRPDFFIYADGQEAMADFSSRGPAEDGRIKPDVVAPGTWIASLRSEFADDNNAWAPISQNYLYQGGTSQAGPGVSGAAAVFVQYYRSLFGATPSPALVKAALIHSAVDMDGDFGTDPVPNNDEGWGRVDLTEIIGSSRDLIWIEQTNFLATGESYEMTVVVDDPGEPLKITLTYTDEPGFPGAIPALVNDLDLEVTGPDGALYRGNRFNNSESIPNATSPDAINNVEGVYLPVPAPGVYTVRVLARNVAQDARDDTPTVDQDFALVLSAGLLPSGQSLIFLNRQAFRAPDVIRVAVIDRDQAGQSSVSATVTSGTELGGEPLTLFAAGAGLFTNSLATATGAAVADGILQIAHDDVIEARYFDASAGVLRTATAAADLVPPVISGVSAVERFGRTDILWQTDEPSDSRVEFGTTVSLGLAASNSTRVTGHTVSLRDLVPGATYHYRVISRDEAGNVRTNDNGGSLFTFTAPTVPPVLILDGHFNDPIVNQPLSEYTTPLNAIGVAFDVWDEETLGAPGASDLRPYRAVVWRVAEFTQPDADTRQAVQDYVEAGGSLFLASMEVLTRLEESGGAAFNTNILQVVAFDVDAGVPEVQGVPRDPVGDGLEFALDYSDYIGFDFGDTLTLSTNAAPIFNETFGGGIAGLRYPRTGIDSTGRVVFLSFPFEALPTGGTYPNNRAGLLERSLQFLVPGINGRASVAMNRSAFTLPSQITMEVGDIDLQGAGQITANIASTTEPGGQTVTLFETTLGGLFRGQISLASAGNPPAAGRLRAVEGDTITLSYFDASQVSNVTATAVVDTTPPVISAVESEPDYSTAFIYWETSEPADTLVQFGETLPLPINRTAFNPALTTGHEITLNGLRPDRQYYYQVVSRDAAGNTTTDNNGGQYYTFTTLTPEQPPYLDNFETDATNWSVFSSDESETEWVLGVPNNGVQTSAHSPVNAWGSSLDGGWASIADTFLISPAFFLTNGNQVTLRFRHSYDFTARSDFDLIEGGELLLVDNDAGSAVALATYFDSNAGWELEEIDLTPYLGRVVYLVWHHVLLSFDYFRRPGWLVDDVEITTDSINAGTITVTNNLSQAGFTLSGPVSRSGAGTMTVFPNMPEGQYTVSFTTVPFYLTPAPQTNSLGAGGSLTFTGNYTFTDANANAIADEWEEVFLGGAGMDNDYSQDTDGDGVSDGDEFMAGTNPTNATSVLSADIDPQPNNRLRLEWPTAPGRSYRLLGTSDLIDWHVEMGWRRAAGSAMSHLLTPGEAAFYRIEVRP